jgi:OmpA-OmpF porin, OOP family
MPMCSNTRKISPSDFTLSKGSLCFGTLPGVGRRTMSRLALLAIPLLVASATQAQEQASFTENGWSMGINAGRGIADINAEALRARLQSLDVDLLSIDEDKHSHAYKVYIGYQLNPYLAVEGGYFDLGDFKFQTSTDPQSFFGGKTEQKGWNLDLVGILPFTDRFSAIARAGVTQDQQRGSFYNNGVIDNNSFNDRNNFINYKAGLGLQYDVSTVFTVRLEAERYMMEDFIGTQGDTEFYSLGLVYRFGAATVYEARPAPRQASAVVRSTATTASVRAEPVVLALEDVHFNFDTSELTESTKLILRQHVRTLAASPEARVRIAGYTSASGTAEYNQKLSERRAGAIKAFLILEGLAPERFKTIGFGETDPAEYEARPSVLRSDAAKANMRGLFEIIVE